MASVPGLGLDRATPGSHGLLLAEAYSSVARCLSTGDAETISAETGSILAAGMRALSVTTADAALASVTKAIGDPGLSRTIAEEHTRLFSLSDGLPYEAAYDHSSRRLALISDVAGFMRAFGLEARDERPDFVATELEFLGFLALLQARAEFADDEARAALAREARKSFIAEHAGRWLGALAHRIRTMSSTPVYPGLLEIAHHLVRADAAILGAEILEVNLHVEPTDGSQPDCSGCAVMAGASGGAP